MTRRMLVILAALAGVVGALLLTSTPASAQVGIPGFDIVSLLRAIFESFPPFLQSFLAPIFNALIAAFAGGCVPPFCASP
ncbi:MAG: hypothetical protein M3203_01775 [Actinomycetota bacterium]|nr:hypothetical protein [Actinomycetota bacterium]